MPFTFSHPALIIPLTYLPRRWYSLTGLVVGSLTPDFEYFLRMKIQSDYSHSVFGLFWFDLPLGLLVAFIFHRIIRESLYDNLPAIIKSKLARFTGFDWNRYFTTNWFIVIISILAGAASHLLWDSFTHNQGYFIEMIPSLSNKVGVANIQIPIFKFLQHLSTLIGGLVIAIYLYKLPSEKTVTSQVSFTYWFMVIGLAMIMIAVRLLCGLDYKLYGHLIVTSISCGLISLIMVPLMTKAIGANR